MMRVDAKCIAEARKLLGYRTPQSVRAWWAREGYARFRHCCGHRDYFVLTEHGREFALRITETDNETFSRQ